MSAERPMNATVRKRQKQKQSEQRQMMIILLVSLEKALGIYYENPELTNRHIRELFGCKAGTATKYKNAALLEQVKADVKTMQPNAVNTEIAFKTWGIDINDIERRLRKLRKLRAEGIVV